jgi:gliding motility-associated-like protein
MSCKKLLLLIVFLFTAISSYAAVFVVTSNADSGPGTLRDALNRAISNSTANTIKFNFIDTTLTGRTITLTTLLPLLPADLVIDGTTQRGAVFGYSAAKVRIISTYQDVPANVYIFKGTNINNCTISGLWLQSTATNYASAKVINLNRANTVNINNCDIQRGQVYADSVVFMYFKSNFVGFLPDGLTVDQASVWAQDCANNIVGGTAAEGNLISGQLSIIRYQYEPAVYTMVSYNKMGIDYTGKISTPQMFFNGDRININFIFSGIITIAPQTSPFSPVTEVISNNIVANFSGKGIYVNQGNDITIKGNLINTDATGSINYFNPPSGAFSNALSTGIYLGDGARFTIGGSSPGDANIIGYVGTGIYETGSQACVISQNSIFCAQGYNQHTGLIIPVIKILSYTNSSISGVAAANATVELFYDDAGKCNTCDPRHYFATTTADGQGNWAYSGTIPLNITVSAITAPTPYSHTSAFTRAQIDLTKMVVTQPTCTQNGAISGVQVYNVPSDSLTWTDGYGTVISHSLDISNLPPGEYKLKVGSVSCGTEMDYIQILNPTPKIDYSKLKVQNATCTTDGSISGISATVETLEHLDFVWTDQNGLAVSGTPDMLTLAPGAYLLSVTGQKNNCTTIYGPITIQTTTGPKLDQTNVVITPNNCGQSIGSITGITATGQGTLTYSWQNAQQQQVGVAKDLLNQPAGTYILQVTDQSGCGSVTSSPIIISELNAITMDQSGIVATDATCGINNGAVTGIKVTGATSYQWFDSNGATVAANADLTNVSGGIYYLIASNGYCAKQSVSFTINTIPVMAYNGSSTIIYNDNCGLKNGSITHVTITGGKKPYQYLWKDAAGNTLSSTADLIGVSTGNYTLTITDATNCQPLVQVMTVGNQTATIGQPAVNNVQLCDKGGALIAVTNASANYGFRLYDNNSSTSPLSSNTNGRFKVSVNADRSYFVSQYLGNCESARSEVKVSIGPSKLDITNTFTPNGDGKNDTWTINGISNFPEANVQVYNRNGQKVFESKGYAVPFDGRMNGQDLPVGTYYYLIYINTKCDVISGSITLLR